VSVADPDFAFLAARGWDMSAPVDTCHLDCPAPGYLKVTGGMEIILCPDDAMVLEAGAWHGDYSGAVTPADSMAEVWPWMPAQVA
jgi:hypothetical protein